MFAPPIFLASAQRYRTYSDVTYMNFVDINPFSAQCCISYRNQSFDLKCKSNNWFLREMQHWAEMG